MEQVTGIQKAVDKFGGSPSKLASAVGNGVIRQHIEHWIKTGRVSPGKCPVVSAATGISCAELNSTVIWSVLQKQPRKQRAVAQVA